MNTLKSWFNAWKPWLIAALVIAALVFSFNTGKDSRDPATCPASTSAARALFGGSPSHWSQDGNAWTMLQVDIARGRRIKAPPWYAYSVTNSEGDTSFFGAPVAERQVTIPEGSNVVFFCPQE